MTCEHYNSTLSICEQCNGLYDCARVEALNEMGKAIPRHVSIEVIAQEMFSNYLLNTKRK